MTTQEPSEGLIANVKVSMFVDVKNVSNKEQSGRECLSHSLKSRLGRHEHRAKPPAFQICPREDAGGKRAEAKQRFLFERKQEKGWESQIREAAPLEQ